MKWILLDDEIFDIERAHMAQTTIDICITIEDDGEVRVTAPRVNNAPSVPLVVRQADSFLSRIGDKNKAMVRAFLDQSGSFSFDDIAKETGETYMAIKMRHFNLGRTINAVTGETGSEFVLLKDVNYVDGPDGKRTMYEVPEELREELSERSFWSVE